jgi:hypothetical protein
MCLSSKILVGSVNQEDHDPGWSKQKRDLSSKITRAKTARGMAQAFEYLPSKCKPQYKCKPQSHQITNKTKFCKQPQQRNVKRREKPGNGTLVEPTYILLWLHNVLRTGI